MNQKGILNLNTLLILAVIVGIGFVVFKFMPTGGGGTLAVAGETDYKVDDAAIKACDGIESVTFNFNDLDKYNVATDPACNNVIVKPFYKSTADDASSVSLPILTQFTAVDCADDASHFGRLTTFKTGCSVLDYQPKMIPAGQPDLTIINSNGATVNSDSSHESVDASSSYTFELKARAPTDECSSGECGAVICLESDATYINKVESNLPSYSGKVLMTHLTNHSGTGLDMDQYDCFLYDKELCDNEQESFFFTVTTTSSTPGEDQANVRVWWLPLNTVVNAENYEPMECVLYDESNNLASIGDINGTTDTGGTWYTA